MSLSIPKPLISIKMKIAELLQSDKTDVQIRKTLHTSPKKISEVKKAVDRYKPIPVR
jgi:hypothetical protein